LRLLEEENVRLKQLVTNLNMDVEMWRKVAQALSTEDASRTVVRRS
jgi:ribosomal protein L18E